MWKSRRVVANREKKVQHGSLRSDMKQNFPLEGHQSIERGMGKKRMSIKIPSSKGEEVDGVSLLILFYFLTKLIKNKRSPKLQRPEESLNN